MSITYTWTIERLDTAPSVGELADVVTCVHWRVAGEDGAHRAEIYGSAGMADPIPDAFSDYDTLTKGEVLGWLADAIDMAAAEATVAQMIADQQAPAVVPREVPWE